MNSHKKLHKKNKIQKYISLLPLLFIIGCGTTRTIPPHRTLDWETVGYNRSPASTLPTAENYIFLDSASYDAQVNYDNIISALKQANKNNGWTAIILDSGEYSISSPIVLDHTYKQIIIRGKGIDKTVVYYNALSKIKRNDILIIRGKKRSRSRFVIKQYNKKSNTIYTELNKIELKVGDLIDIRSPNGRWHNSENHKRWNPEDYFGQVVEVSSINEETSEIGLMDDISIVWQESVQDSLIPYFEIIEPAKEIGIENLKLVADTLNNRHGNNITFQYAQNCWVKNIESINPPLAHISIHASSSILIRDSYFHHAQDYGYIGGAGYGVQLFNRSTNCLIENNIFEHLRHSMVIERGANKNVFGYNYSFDQYSFPAKNLSDLNIHGHYSFGNLFEGNYVEKIEADRYWGMNGPYNTIFRNFIRFNLITLKESDKTNIVGNVSDLKVENSEMILNSLRDSTKTLIEASYYRNSKPEFYDESFSWPSIGYILKDDGLLFYQNIPARKRYCSWKDSDCDDE